MAIDVRLVGSGVTGREQAVQVGSRQFLQVALREGDAPPYGEVNRFRYFNSLVGSTGADSGTTDMKAANGSSTPQEFFIGAHEDYDIRLMLIVVFIGDASITHPQFGGLSALATGFDLKVTEAGVETFIIKKAKTNADFLLQGSPGVAWGDQQFSFELTNYSGTNDAFFMTINMGAAVPNGLRIGRGSRDRLSAIVNDDLTGLENFTVRAIGYRHYP